MHRYDLPDMARRIQDALADLGYADDAGRIDRKRAYRVTSRRTCRPLEEGRFRDMVDGRGPGLSADEAVQLADGLGFDVRRILYEEIPRHAERPKSMFDELDQIGLPG